MTRIYFGDEPEANATDPVLASIADPVHRATLVTNGPTAGTGTDNVASGRARDGLLRCLSCGGGLVRTDPGPGAPRRLRSVRRRVARGDARGRSRARPQPERVPASSGTSHAEAIERRRDERFDVPALSRAAADSGNPVVPFGRGAYAGVVGGPSGRPTSPPGGDEPGHPGHGDDAGAPPGGARPGHPRQTSTPPSDAAAYLGDAHREGRHGRADTAAGGPDDVRGEGGGLRLTGLTTLRPSDWPPSARAPRGPLAGGSGTLWPRSGETSRRSSGRWPQDVSLAEPVEPVGPRSGRGSRISQAPSARARRPSRSRLDPGPARADQIGEVGDLPRRRVSGSSTPPTSEIRWRPSRHGPVPPPRRRSWSQSCWSRPAAAVTVNGRPGRGTRSGVP